MAPACLASSLNYVAEKAKENYRAPVLRQMEEYIHIMAWCSHVHLLGGLRAHHQPCHPRAVAYPSDSLPCWKVIQIKCPMLTGPCISPGCQHVEDLARLGPHPQPGHAQCSVQDIQTLKGLPISPQGPSRITQGGRTTLWRRSLSETRDQPNLALISSHREPLCSNLTLCWNPPLV